MTEPDDRRSPLEQRALDILEAARRLDDETLKQQLQTFRRMATDQQQVRMIRNDLIMKVSALLVAVQEERAR